MFNTIRRIILRAPILALSSGLVLGACAAPSGEGVDGTDEALTSTGAELLVGAGQGSNVNQDLASRSDFTNLSTFGGRIKIASAGSVGRHVYIRYRAREEKSGKELRSWTNADATWVAGNVWEFKTPKISRHCTPTCEGVEYAFALAAEAGGKTSWNNNGTANFRVVDGPVMVATFGEQRVLRSNDYYSSSARKVLVHAIHDNPNAKVKVHYSTDGWATAQDQEAKGDVREKSGKVVRSDLPPRASRQDRRLCHQLRGRRQRVVGQQRRSELSNRHHRRLVGSTIGTVPARRAALGPELDALAGSPGAQLGVVQLS
jgi:hypothetical protein